MKRQDEPIELITLICWGVPLTLVFLFAVLVLAFSSGEIAEILLAAGHCVGACVP
jgi:cytochrome c-type biogenesis protein CcmH/NrfF